MKQLRLISWMAAVASLAGAELGANQLTNQSGQTPERVSVSAQEPLRLTVPPWIEPTPKRFGVLTITQPERRGEIVQVSVPIGDLTIRAAHAIGQAQHRRAERKARKEVEQAIKDLLPAQR